MTQHDGFDRTVSDWLDAQAGHGMPAYLDEILARTDRTRQRPWWSSPERWLPMQSTTRFAQVPRVAWLLVVLGLIIALGTTILVVGAPKPLPSPFGPGAHGKVLYAAPDGDIYAIDAATNVARPLIVGPATDSGPYLSPDGTKFVFDRRDAGSSTTATFVANVDGSSIRQLTGMSDGPDWMAWSPNSDQLAVVGEVDGSRGLWIVGSDVQSKLVALEQPGTQDSTFGNPQWRPNGHELIYLTTATENLGFSVGLNLVQTDGTGVRTIVAPTVAGLAYPTMSPDGSKVAYSIRETDHSEIHVVDVETAADHRAAFDGTAADLRPHWSPDGTKLVFERSSGGTYQLMVGSSDGGKLTAIGPTQPDKTGGADVQFSPDGARILAFYNADRTSWILDPAGGPGTQLDYVAVSPPTWQHLAD